MNDLIEVRQTCVVTLVPESGVLLNPGGRSPACRTIRVEGKPCVLQVKRETGKQVIQPETSAITTTNLLARSTHSTYELSCSETQLCNNLTSLISTNKTNISCLQRSPALSLV